MSPHVRSLALLCVTLFSPLLSSLLAVPVAVGDAYKLDEDTVLQTATVTLIQANFDGNDLLGAWNFLDKIKNQLTPVSS